MAKWNLIDYRYEMKDESDEKPISITSRSEFWNILQGFRDESPGMFVIEGIPGEELQFGLGNNCGYLYWVNHNTGEKGYAENESVKKEDKFVIFRSEGVDDEIPIQYVFPFDLIVDNLIYYYQYGQLENSINWKIWRPKKY